MSESKWPNENKSWDEIQEDAGSLNELNFNDSGDQKGEERKVEAEQVAQLVEVRKERSIHDDLACAVNLPPEVGENNSARGNFSGMNDGNNNSGKRPPEDSIDGFSSWFKKNNPLYLLSVLFMLLGLHLVSSDAKASNVGVQGLMAFFAVQNIYEIIMVGMALYLLKFRVHQGHGKLLLVFVLLFLGDVTFYQVRISGLSVWYGNMATMIYMLLAGVKLAAVIKVLGLTLYHWRIFYVFSSFSLIWIGPKIAYNIMDSVGTQSSSYFDATTIIYLVWLYAGLIHLPIIIKNWRNNQLNATVNNPLVGNETTFWRYLIIFPFIMMPIQLFINVMADSSLAISKSTPPIALVIPWIIMAGFFAQSLWRKQIDETVGINNYDSVLLCFSLLLVMATMHADLLPVMINFVLTIAGLLITCYTRENLINGLALALLVVYFSGRQLLFGISKAVTYGSGLSKTAWAAILMFGSFVMLGLGFLISLRKNGGRSDSVEPTTGETF